MKNPLSVALGSTFIAAMAASPVTFADTNPFGMQDLENGYMQLAEAKCGGSKMKAEEAKCGGSKMKAEEGKCGDSKMKAKEAKCGEGKCGEGMMKKKSEEGKCGSKE